MATTEDPIVIVAGARTPMGGFQGVLSNVTAPELGAASIKAVVERGGILGMAFDAIMMVPGWTHLRSKPSDFQLKIERICDHIDHICQIAGNAKHIGIGTDLDGGYGTEQTPMDMNSIADLQTLPGLLRARGYSQDDIEGIMWRNFVDFLRKTWK